MKGEYCTKRLTPALNLALKLFDNAVQSTEFGPAKRIASYFAYSPISIREELDRDFKNVCVGMSHFAVPDVDEFIVKGTLARG